MYIVIYREHGKMLLDTKYYGVFSFAIAYDFLSSLPELGVCEQGLNPGVKYIEQLSTPTIGE